MNGAGHLEALPILRGVVAMLWLIPIVYFAGMVALPLIWLRGRPALRCYAIIVLVGTVLLVLTGIASARGRNRDIGSQTDSEGCPLTLPRQGSETIGEDEDGFWLYQ